MKILERYKWRRFGVFIVNFEQISHIVLVFLLFSLDKKIPNGEEELYHRTELKISALGSLKNSH